MPGAGGTHTHGYPVTETTSSVPRSHDVADNDGPESTEEQQYPTFGDELVKLIRTQHGLDADLVRQRTSLFRRCRFRLTRGDSCVGVGGGGEGFVSHGFGPFLPKLDYPD